MIFEAQLRQLSVGQRIALILTLLLLPMAGLSVASMMVLNEQELTFRATVEESVHTLLPLTTLEHYLQRALVDELEAQSHESVPNFAALTDNIDKSFATIEGAAPGADLQEDVVVAAQHAWTQARPSVQHLIEQVRMLHPRDDVAAETQTQSELQQAIQDISGARQHLSEAVQARYARAVAARHMQLRWLVWSWVITLAAAALLVGLLLQSLLGPIRALGVAAKALGTGASGVRAPVHGNDELTLLAERFNEMAAYWEASHRSLLTEAMEDPLTGALNRRGILAALETELIAHARQQQPLALFMIDLDHFKAINDHFGHSAGDRALIWVTRRMREMLRAGDRLGRYGGDEFMIVLPDTSLEQAQQIAGRMGPSISEAAARETACPAISIGVAAAPDHGWEVASLIEAADRMLYANKQRRRTGIAAVARVQPPG